MDPHDTLLQALRLAVIVADADDAIISKDTNGIITSWNAGAERMFGYTATEAIGQSIRIVIPADRQSEADLVLSSIRRGQRVDHFETQRCRRDGELVDVSITVSPIRTPDGRVVGASKIARDISDRRRAERALAEVRAAQVDLRRRLTTIIDASGHLLMSPRTDDVLPALLLVAREVLPSDAVAVWRADDGQWRVAASHGLSASFVETSSVASTFFNAPIGDALVLESMDDPCVSTCRDAHIREGIASMLVLPLRVGSRMAASIAFYYQQPRAVGAVERENVQRLGRLASAVIATAELYESQRRRRMEADFVAETGAILASSLDYRDTLARLARRAVPQVADWCAFHLDPGDGRIECAASAARDASYIDTVERFVRSAGGSMEGQFSVERVIETGVPLLISEWPSDGAGLDEVRREAARRLDVASVIGVPLLARGRVLGALTLGARRQDARLDDNALRFAQDLAYRVGLSVDNSQSYEQARTANRLKDEFLANLSHELRTPLNAILGYSRMLAKGTMPEERKARAYDVLDKNASVLTQIVEDVLDISRIVSGKIRLALEPTPLEPIVMHSIETVQPGADAKGVRVQLEPCGTTTTVAGDADRLQQVFWNLLSNAVKFTPRGGLISVHLACGPHACEVAVSDNGAGIEPALLPHVFDRFRQGDSRHGREHGGLGLGLAIARQIVEMHGGVIEAESAGAGHGSTFRVVLPLLRG
ncbi:MAG: ATP-binding protein [Vicinamibacterales bacterium]